MNRIQVMSEIADGIRCAVCEEPFGATPCRDQVRIGTMGEYAHRECAA